MKFTEFLNETTEKLFIVRVTDLENKSVGYLTSLDGPVFFAVKPDFEKAIAVTKDEYQKSSMRERIETETYKTYKVVVQSKKKWKAKLIPYVPNINELIPINVVQNNKQFKYSDVKSYFKKAGIKILFEEKKSYKTLYGSRVTYNTIYIDNQDLEKAEDLIDKQLKNQIDIGFAWPDKRTSASDKLKYDKK